MKKMMKAAVMQEIGRFEVKEIPVPEYGSKDILVKIKYAGICGSDTSVYKKGYPVEKFPIVPGHEFSSEIVAMGSEVENLTIGDRVMGLNIEFCGECWWCKNDDYGHCPHVAKVGIGFFKQGAFAEYLVIENARVGFNVHKIPEALDDKEGALIEPFCVGAGITQKVDVQNGDKVIVIGAGIVGLSILLAAKEKGAEVLMVNRSKERLKLAKKLGADDVFSPVDGDLVEYVVNKWGNGTYAYHYGENAGGMADICFDAAGAHNTLNQCFELVRSGGKVCPVAASGNKVEIDPNYIMLKDPKVYGGLGGDFAKSAELLASDLIDGYDVISHEFDLEDIDEAFQMAMDTKKSMKVLLKIGE